MLLPPNIPKKWDKFSSAFGVRHVIICISRGIINACNNKATGEILYLVKQAFQPTCIFGKPLIHQGISRSEDESSQGRGGVYTGGDVLTWGLWEIHNNPIIDIRLEDADEDTYKYDPMDKIQDCGET